MVQTLLNSLSRLRRRGAQQRNLLGDRARKGRDHQRQAKSLLSSPPPNPSPWRSAGSRGPSSPTITGRPNPRIRLLHHTVYTSMKSMHEPKLGLWGALARKVKGVLDEDAAAHKFDDYRKDQTPRKFDSSNGAQAPQSHWSFENYGRTQRSESRTRSEALAASVNQLGGRIRNALEEGLTIVDNKTANIIEETKKIQIRRKPNCPSSYTQNLAADTFTPPNFSQKQAEASAQETQLKASRDVRLLMQWLLKQNLYSVN